MSGRVNIIRGTDLSPEEYERLENGMATRSESYAKPLPKSIKIVSADRPIDEHSHPSHWREAWAPDKSLSPSQVLETVEKRLGRTLTAWEARTVLEEDTDDEDLKETVSRKIANGEYSGGPATEQSTFWEKITAAQEQREERYGNLDTTADGIGLIMTAMIQSRYGIKLPYPIPADLAILLCSARKIVRMAKPVYVTDDAVDTASYMELADRLKVKEGGTK